MAKIPYKLIRSGRRTLALIVDRDGALIARAPYRVSVKAIEAFIAEKESWIKSKQLEAEASRAEYVPFSIREGAVLMHLGAPLALAAGGCAQIRAVEGALRVPAGCRVEDVRDWMKAEAARVIPQRTEYCAGLMGESYKSLRLSDARSRWGSCGAKGTLNLAWRLVMCPVEVIDYVAIHELSHIAQKNHGPLFWSRVAEYCPDYKSRREWLSQRRWIMDLI